MNKAIKIANITVEALAIILMTAVLFTGLRMWAYYTDAALAQYDYGVITLIQVVTHCIVFAIPAIIGVGITGGAIFLVASSIYKKIDKE